MPVQYSMGHQPTRSAIRGVKVDSQVDPCLSSTRWRGERQSTGQAPTHARGSRLKPGFATPHRQRSFVSSRRARASDCIVERVRNERCERDPEIRSISSDIVVSIDGVLGSFLSRGA
jgi:hypothetical protein